MIFQDNIARKYLQIYSKKYGILNNFYFYCKESFIYDKLGFILSLFLVPAGIIKSLASIFIPKLVIDSLGNYELRRTKVKIIDIVGENYLGSWDKTRTACRGIVIDGEHMLLSYETKTNQWMIPGGGVEDNESDEECCIREIAEETGIEVEPLRFLLEIDEYYENWKWVNKYFICKAVGTTQIKQTEEERQAGMEPRWLQIAEIKDIFSKHNLYNGIDEMRRGMYLREYTALRVMQIP